MRAVWAVRAVRAGTGAGGRRRLRGTLVVGVATASVLGPARAEPVSAASTIETTYKASGGWAVSSATVTDAAGRSYVLRYPTNLGAGGFDHPILTWGNGTDSTPGQYPGVLNHLASWGFVLVASTSTATGSGTQMLAGVEYLIQQNGNASSAFHQKLDITKVGALGHSQGAGGALNATTSSDGLITSTLPLNLPNPIWVEEEHRTDFSLIADPVFFVTGTNDLLISTPAGQTGYYNQVSGPAAKASLKGAGHNTIKGTGGGYLGYITAWFMYTLRGDTTARAAFVGTPPELPTNTAWANQATKNLP